MLPLVEDVGHVELVKEVLPCRQHEPRLVNQKEVIHELLAHGQDGTTLLFHPESFALQDHIQLVGQELDLLPREGEVHHLPSFLVLEDVKMAHREDL